MSLYPQPQAYTAPPVKDRTPHVVAIAFAVLGALVGGGAVGYASALREVNLCRESVMTMAKVPAPFCQAVPFYGDAFGTETRALIEAAAKMPPQELAALTGTKEAREPRAEANDFYEDTRRQVADIGFNEPENVMPALPPKTRR